MEVLKIYQMELQARITESKVSELLFRRLHDTDTKNFIVHESRQRDA